MTCFEYLLGDKRFTIQVVISKRLKRNMRMRVIKADTIQVSCPFRIDKPTIIATLQQFSQKLCDDANAIAIDNNKDFWHLGECYQPPSHDDKNIDCDQDPFHMVHHLTPHALELWRKHKMLDYLESNLFRLIAIVPWVKATPPFKVRKMRSRWGSCSHKGAITINSLLIQAPPICIDYVILHELCHLQEFNHSPRFYALMDQVMPEWRAHRQYLREMGRIFLG